MLAVYVKYWTEYKTGSDYLNYLYAYGIGDRCRDSSRSFLLSSFTRYLNTHYVKKKQTTDLDHTYTPLGLNTDTNDQPLVEIGEVKIAFRRQRR